MNKRATVVLFGGTAVGKSNLIRAIQGFDFNPSSEVTIGVDYIAFDQFVIWDTPGPRGFRTIVLSYLRSADAIVWCRSETCDDHWTIEDFHGYRDKLVILETRADEPHTDKVQKFAEVNGLPYIGACSSKSRVGIRKFMDFCIQQGKNKMEGI